MKLLQPVTVHTAANAKPALLMRRLDGASSHLLQCSCAEQNPGVKFASHELGAAQTLTRVASKAFVPKQAPTQLKHCCQSAELLLPLGSSERRQQQVSAWPHTQSRHGRVMSTCPDRLWLLTVISVSLQPDSTAAIYVNRIDCRLGTAAATAQPPTLTSTLILPFSLTLIHCALPYVQDLDPFRGHRPAPHQAEHEARPARRGRLPLRAADAERPGYRHSWDLDAVRRQRGWRPKCRLDRHSRTYVTARHLHDIARWQTSEAVSSSAFSKVAERNTR